MNNVTEEVRRRGQNLLVVEGNHEKQELFWLIFRCFPEININMADVWIYGTNIYMLYQDIEKEYGTGWTEDDIDLPFVISKKQSPDALRYKNDFTNIILVFDYERHDPNFSEAKILEMQGYFTDAADRGMLYINYPMIESYQHFRSLPDADFINRKIPVSLQPGKKYKELVRKETMIRELVEFPHKVETLLYEHFKMEDRQLCEECREVLLAVSEEQKIKESLEKIVCHIVGEELQKTAEYYFMNLISKTGYLENKKTYWAFMRNIFQQIIIHNISKAVKIQKGQGQIEENKYKDSFEALNLVEILKIQNEACRDLQNGFIWVLNTCVFFVAKYNFLLVLEQERV